MRIHTKATATEVGAAASKAGVTIERWGETGSRVSDRTFNILLSGESGRRTNGGGYGSGEDEAATWDQWGIFLAAIFEADPTTRCGSFYADAEDFHTKTCHRFDASLAEDYPEQIVLSQASPDYKITAHRWTYDHESSQPLSGIAIRRCKGHSTKRNKRSECSAGMSNR